MRHRFRLTIPILTWSFLIYGLTWKVEADNSNQQTIQSIGDQIKGVKIVSDDIKKAIIAVTPEEIQGNNQRDKTLPKPVPSQSLIEKALGLPPESLSPGEGTQAAFHLTDLGDGEGNAIRCEGARYHRKHSGITVDVGHCLNEQFQNARLLKFWNQFAFAVKETMKGKADVDENPLVNALSPSSLNLKEGRTATVLSLPMFSFLNENGPIFFPTMVLHSADNKRHIVIEISDTDSRDTKYLSSNFSTARLENAAKLISEEFDF